MEPIYSLQLAVMLKMSVLKIHNVGVGGWSFGVLEGLPARGGAVSSPATKRAKRTATFSIKTFALPLSFSYFLFFWVVR